MAAVTPEERRMLMDFFGVDSAEIDAMSAEKAMRGLEQYHQSGKLAQYEVVPVPPAFDWISAGLVESGKDVAAGFQSGGDVIIGATRQVGVGIKGLTNLGLFKFVAPAVLVFVGYILYLRYGK